MKSITKPNRYGVLKLKGKEGNPVEVRFVQEGCYLYFNAQHVLLQLSPIMRSFLDFLCEKMRADTNTLEINKELKEGFVEHIKSITNNRKAPSVNSLNMYV